MSNAVVQQQQQPPRDVLLMDSIDAEAVSILEAISEVKGKLRSASSKKRAQGARAAAGDSHSSRAKPRAAAPSRAQPRQRRKRRRHTACVRAR